MNDLDQFVAVLFYLECLKCVQFSLTFFDTLKYGCVIKTSGMFNFLSVINTSVTIELSFLLLIISPIISSKAIKKWFNPLLHLVIKY